jgi:hypothetical protein
MTASYAVTRRLAGVVEHPGLSVDGASVEAGKLCHASSTSQGFDSSSGGMPVGTENALRYPDHQSAIGPKLSM